MKTDNTKAFFDECDRRLEEVKNLPPLTITKTKMKTKKWSEKFKKDFMTKRFGFPNPELKAIKYFTRFIQDLLDSQRAELLERLPKGKETPNEGWVTSGGSSPGGWKIHEDRYSRDRNNRISGYNQAISEVRDLLTKEEK